MAYQSISFRPSSNILSVAFDPETKDLKVSFVRGGRTYLFHGVDSRTAEGFSQAPSAGRYFNAEVKDFFVGEEV